MIILGWEEICHLKIIQHLSVQNSFLCENILLIWSSNSTWGLCLPSQKEGPSWAPFSPRCRPEGEAYYVHSVRAKLLSTCCPLGLHWPERKSVISLGQHPGVPWHVANSSVSCILYCCSMMEYWVVIKYLYIHKKWNFHLPTTQLSKKNYTLFLPLLSAICLSSYQFFSLVRGIMMLNFVLSLSYFYL